MGKYGTNLEGFGAFEGGVNADNGATLVSTNSDGEKSQLFGAPALREIQAGVANGDFEVVPNDATGAISESNPLPYFSFTDNSSGRIVASIADSTRAPGQTVLRFTLTSALAADEVYFTRYVPITTSEARTYGNQPRVAIAAATNSANYQITWSAQYVRADLSTTTGAVGSTSKSGATMFLEIGTDTGAEYQLNPNGTGSAPVDAAYLLLTLSVNATGAVASATLDIAEIRIDRSQIQYLLTDQALPDSYGPAALYLYQGTLFLSNGGVVGSEPKITISANSGNIGIDATTQGDEITLTGAARTGTTVAIGTTRPHGFETGYEVIVAGITGVPGTTMNGTFIVTKQNTTVFTYTAAGTAGSATVTGATVKSGPGIGIIYLKPAATAAGRVEIQGPVKTTGYSDLSGSLLSALNRGGVGDSTVITTAGTYYALTNAEVTFTPQFVGQRWLVAYTAYGSINTNIVQYALVNSRITNSSNTTIADIGFARFEATTTTSRSGTVAFTAVWVADAVAVRKFKLYGTVETTSGRSIGMSYTQMTAYPIG
jgi:hypothetical protein